MQAGQAALDQPHDRAAGAGRGGGRDDEHAPGLRDHRHLPRSAAVAGADGEAAAAGLQRDKEAAVRRAGDGLDHRGLRGELLAPVIEAHDDALPGDIGRDHATDADPVTAQDDDVVADAVNPF